ncbi:MAG: PQQ-binding-like beta-propeller repeat protein [Planctomycetota bacterium]
MVNNIRFRQAMAWLLWLCVVGPVAAETWSQYRGDSRWSSFYDATIDPTRFSPLWQKDRVAFDEFHEVAIDGGQVYWLDYLGFSGSHHGFVFTASSLTDGHNHWENELDARSKTSARAPTLAAERVFVAVAGHSNVVVPQPWDAPRLMGFNRATGQREVQRIQTDQHHHTGRPVALGNDLVVPGGEFGGMYSYRADTATQQWFNNLGNEGYPNPTPMIHGDYVITSVSGTEVQRLHRTTGQQADTLSLLDEGTTSSGGKYRAITADGQLVSSSVLHPTEANRYGLTSFDLETGVMNWQFGFDREFARGVAVGHGRVAFSRYNKVYVLDDQTGQAEIEWTASGFYNTYDVLLTRSHAIVQTSDGLNGRIHAINLATGHSEWMVDANGSLAANNGVLVVANNTEISAFRIAPPDPLTVVPSTDAAATFNGTGYDLTFRGSSILTQQLDFADIDRRAILEFDLSGREQGFSLSRAVLKLDPSVYTFDGNNFPQISIYGYIGNGIAEEVDATQTAQLLAVSDPVMSLDPFEIELDPADLDQLLADGNWLGLLVVGSENGKQLGFNTTESSFGIAPSLTLEYSWLDLAGDYNSDGEVNAADYTVWADSFGSRTLLAADGNNNGVIDAADYTIWADNFGMTTGLLAAGSANVPEPGTVALVLTALPVLCTRRRLAA